MKRITAFVLALMLVLSVMVMTGCKKDEKKEDSSSSSAASIPEDLTPIAQNKDGSPTGYTKLDKDDKGRVTRDYTYDSLGNLQGSIGHEYDDRDFVIKDTHYNAAGDVTGIVLYERNDNGLETKRTETDPKGTVKRVIVTKYGEDGSVTREQYDGNGKPLN